MKGLFKSSSTTSILESLKEILPGSSTHKSKNADTQKEGKAKEVKPKPPKKLKLSAADITFRNLKLLPSYTQTPCYLPKYAFAKPLTGTILIQSNDPDVINVYLLQNSYRFEINTTTDNNSNTSNKETLTPPVPIMKIINKSKQVYIEYLLDDGKIWKTLTGTSALSNLKGLKSKGAIPKESGANLDEFIIDLEVHKKIFEQVKQNKKSEFERKGALEMNEETEIILERDRSLTDAMEPDLFTELENSYVDYSLAQISSNNNNTAYTNKLSNSKKQTWEKCLVRCMHEPKDEVLGLKLSFVDKDEKPTTIYIGRTAQKFVEDNLLNATLEETSILGCK